MMRYSCNLDENDYDTAICGSARKSSFFIFAVSISSNQIIWLLSMNSSADTVIQVLKGGLELPRGLSF